MTISSEYKKSLKSLEAEEFFDLYLFRPISFLFIKLIYNTNITPNQLSIAALIFGVLAGILYGFGTYEFFVLASISFFICNTLDCADGQLARLKNNGTKVGRIIDGFIDYLSSISIFLGIGIALSSITGDPLYSWGLTIAAGISKAIQNMKFDYYRNLYLEHVYGKVSGIEDEINEFKQEKQRLKDIGGNKFNLFLIDIYLIYSGFQKNSGGSESIKTSPEIYRRKNELLLRLWSWLGSTTHLVALVVLTLMNKIDLYLILTITLGNIYLLILIIAQRSAIKSLSPNTT